MKTLRAILYALIAFSFAAPATAREWLRAETPEFVIYSDGYPQETERWARKIVMFDSLLKAIYGGKEDPRGSPLTVFLLKDPEDVARLAGRKNLTGFYSASSEGSFAIASRKPGYFKNQLSGQMTLFHEYGHHFMYRHFPGAYPVWYQEGFAEYVSTVTFDMDWRWTFGQPATARLKYLARDPMPVETILTASVDDFRPNEKARFYAWSWRLMHLLNSRPERKAQLDRYLDLFAAGMPPAQAARAFGDLKALENELLSAPVAHLGPVADHPPLADVPEITVAPLDRVASRLVDLRLSRLADENDEAALASLRSLAASHPDDPDVALELALAERKAAIKDSAGDFTAAESAAGRALALAPRSARAVAVWADLASRRLKRSSDANPADWIAVRRTLLRAIRLDPDDPFALMTYFRTFLREPAPPVASAYGAMDKAFALQPESIEVRVLQIYALSLRGRFDDARELARVLASDPHNSGLGKRALATLTRMEDSSDASRTKPAD